MNENETSRLRHENHRGSTDFPSGFSVPNAAEFSAGEVFVEGLNQGYMKTNVWSFRWHLLIGLALCGAILGLVLPRLMVKPRVIEKPLQVATQSRPIHLAALDPAPELPAYLLTLCGPEVLALHGGMNPAGGMPDWFLKAGRTLAEKGIAWPKPKIGLTDNILLSNVRVLESEAMGLLATDPEAAVAKMQRLIAIEEEKFKTRSWRSALASSAASHDGRPESDLYRAMLDDIPGHYFDGIITETLGNHPDSELAAIAIAQALKREPKVRQPGLAAVIQMHQLAFEVREKAAKALAAELQISFSPADVDGRDWTSEVGDRLYHASLTAPADDAEAVQK